MYKISEFASICGTTPKTIRFYDNVGVLKADYIDPWNGYRYYTNLKVHQYHKIVSLKEIGFTIDEIKNNFLNADDDVVLAVLKEKENNLLRAYQNCKKVISIYEEKIKMLNEQPNKTVKITGEGDTVILNNGTNSVRVLCAPDNVDECINAFNNLLNTEGIINLNFNDIAYYTKSDKPAEVLRGFATGEGREIAAAKQVTQAMRNSGEVKSLVMMCNTSRDTSIEEIDAMNREVCNNINANAAIIWGVSFMEEGDKIFKLTAVCFY